VSPSAGAAEQGKKQQTTPVENRVDIVSDGGSTPPASTKEIKGVPKGTSFVINKAGVWVELPKKSPS